MDPILDIFNDDAFSVVNLTAAINDITFVPGRIGELGLFDERPQEVTLAAFEKQGDLLVLVPPSARGGPGTTIGKTDKGDIRVLTVPHFEINDAVMAEEAQNVRAFGSGGRLETLVNKIAQRQAVHVKSFAATEEHARMGAVQGIITYADGSTLNSFSEFGVSQIAEIDWDLDNANPTDGDLRKKCAALIRSVQGVLGGVPFTGIHTFCGDNFFDLLLAHPEVRATYKNWTEAQILREAYIGPNRSSYGIFEFGGIVWENYRGAVGSTMFVDPDKCHHFPVGVPGLFQSVRAPADYEETVNTMAERLYMRQYPMPNGKGRHLDSQMNALQICTRPRALLKGKKT